MFTRIQRAYPIDYYWIWTPEAWEWTKVNQSNPVFEDAVHDLEAALAGTVTNVGEECKRDCVLTTQGHMWGVVGVQPTKQ